MDKKLIIAALAAPLLSACVIDPGYRYSEVVLEPGLPRIVEIGPSPYYTYGGFVYLYDNDRWAYSRSRSGPWTALPRDHYPREIRYRDGYSGRGYDGDGHHGRR